MSSGLMQMAGGRRLGESSGSRSSTESGSDGEFYDSGELPDTVRRSCTDAGWVAAAVVCYAAYMWAISDSIRCGDLGRHTGFESGDGTRCMIDSGAEFLFFCNNDTGSALSGELELDIEHGVCVHFCPNSSDTMMKACGGSTDYPSHGVMGMVCIPDYLGVFSKHRQSIQSYEEAAKLRVLTEVIIQRWRCLAVCWFIAVVASYVEICVLEYNAGCLVRFGLVTLSAGCLLSAGFLLKWYHFADLLPAPSPYNIPGAVVLLSLGIFFALVLWSAQDSVDMATACMELACTCVMQTKSLALQPLVTSLIQFLHMLLTLYGVLMISSRAKHHWAGDGTHYVLEPEDRISVGMLFLTFTTINLMIFGLTEFVMAYGSIHWYFARRAQPVLDGSLQQSSATLQRRSFLFSAYGLALRYHIGTFLLGGLVVGWSRLFRLPLKVISGWMHMDNPVARCFGCLCCCLVSAYNAVRVWSKSAFIDVAINATPFFPAARNADCIAKREMEAVRILHGATSLFQVVGVCANAGLGACAMLYYSNQVMGDDAHVTLTMCSLGALVSAISAQPFAMIFDTVADTILYCYVIEEIRRKDDPLEGMAQKPTRACICFGKISGDGGPRSALQDFLSNFVSPREVEEEVAMMVQRELI